ncbi:MAG TPA: hypothetical protein VI136_06700 [Verrucomicrobiae bacterium]
MNPRPPTVCDHQAVPSRRHFGSCLAVLVAILVTPGCLVIPTPEFNSGAARANISKHTANQFQPGQTTRADVILALGEPDAVSPNERDLAYRAEKICGFWFVGGYYSGAAGVVSKDRCLVLSFDTEGRLQKVERSTQWFALGTPDKVLPGTSPIAHALLCEPIHKQHPGEWFPGLNGFRDKGWERFPGQPGQFLLSESNVFFVTRAQLANTSPAFTAPYASLVECRVDNYFFGRRLVIRTRDGYFHTFTLQQKNGGACDREATQAVCDFLNARLKGAPATMGSPTTPQVR